MGLSKDAWVFLIGLGVGAVSPAVWAYSGLYFWLDEAPWLPVVFLVTLVLPLVGICIAFTALFVHVNRRNTKIDKRIGNLLGAAVLSLILWMFFSFADVIFISELWLLLVIYIFPGIELVLLMVLYLMPNPPTKPTPVIREKSRPTKRGETWYCPRCGQPLPAGQESRGCPHCSWKNE
jgi:hypothetical protein